nr:MAG TPA: hypothetical protein [Bacteriophage sp.]
MFMVLFKVYWFVRIDIPFLLIINQTYIYYGR